MNDTYEEIQTDLETLSSIDKLDFTEASLFRMRKQELIELCDERDLNTSGTKADLVERLIDYSELFIEAESSIVFVSEDKEKEKDVIGKGERV